ncbi:MAG TPA: GFA family protein [Burkholderiales bacterium]
MDTGTGASNSLSGRCTCGQVRYRMLSTPLFVHCCHCTWCQRETGSAFVVNALIEADRFELVQGEIEHIDTPTSSGRGQEIARCPVCKVALWSHYSAARRAIHFVRVGTLKNPGACPPDIHIYTSTRQPWVALPTDVPAVAEYYRRSDYWPAESIARYRKAVGK